MSATSASSAPREGIFERVVCGIDESPQSLEALRQVELLRPTDGSLHLVSVVERSLAVHGGFAAPHLLEEIEAGAQQALDHARKSCQATSYRLIDGSPASALLREIERLRATVVALGSHGTSRSVGILLGTTATTVLHQAPCSVLLARDPEDSRAVPSIVVGVDGSGPSLRALEAAQELGARLDAPVRVLVASGGKPVHFEGLRPLSALEWDERKPVEALVDASASADLLVIGSRGLHGVSALGSVSERVAHQAASSVLIVRTAP